MIRIIGLLLFIFGTCLLVAQNRIGTASYYSTKFEGRKTATGSIFSNQKMTAASNNFRLGEWVTVTNTLNGKSVTVLINDRMAKNSTRLIDLTQQAAKELCFLGDGLCRVNIAVLTEQEEIEQLERIKKDSINQKE